MDTKTILENNALLSKVRGNGEQQTEGAAPLTTEVAIAISATEQAMSRVDDYIDNEGSDSGSREARAWDLLNIAKDKLTKAKKLLKK
jgi:hypothetical protein